MTHDSVGERSDALKPSDRHPPNMHVTVEVVGGETHEVAIEADETTYAELIDEAGFHPEEATALVDGRPVPEDRPVTPDVERVRVLRLVHGG